MKKNNNNVAAVVVPPTPAYRRQAMNVLMNAFPRVSFDAIRAVFSAVAFNFSEAFRRISVLAAQRNGEDDGKGKFDNIPQHIKVFIKNKRPKKQFDLIDKQLLAEIDDIPELGKKDAAKTPVAQRSTAVPLTRLRQKRLEQTIDLTSDSSDDEGRDEEEKECLCCYGDYPVSVLNSCDNGHEVCSDCIQRYVSEQCDGNGSTVFKCIASSDCDCRYSLVFLEKVLSPTLNKRAAELVAMEEIRKASGDGNDDSFWKCPTCSYMGFIEGKYPWIACPQCNLAYCTSCNVSHPNRTCEEYRREQVMGQDPKHLVAEAMSRATQRSCPRCNQNFIIGDGCNKITCACGAKCCYLCGVAVADYSHFCNNSSHRQSKKVCNSCGKCPLFTSNHHLIDREKRHEAGRKVLIEQGITDAEEIAAILHSLDKGDEDTTAPIQQGAANQRVAAAAVRREVPAAPGRAQRNFEADINDALAAAGIRLDLRAFDNVIWNGQLLGHLGAPPPPPPPPQPQAAAAAFVAPQNPPPPPPPPGVAFAFGAPPAQFQFGQLPDPPAVQHPAQPQGFAFGAAAPVPQREPAFRFGAAPVPQGGQLPAVAAGQNHHRQEFVFGGAQAARAGAQVARAEAQARAQAARAEAQAARAGAQVARAIAANRRDRVGHQADNPPVFGVPAQEQRNANQLAEGFQMLRLGPADEAPGGARNHGDNERVGGRQPAGRVDDANADPLRLFFRLMKSARRHASEGRAEEMNIDLERARELAMRPNARLAGIEMNYYEASAQRTRASLRVPGANLGA